ncbi:MAG: magnesium/cobalt transporter CorA [Candidatus Aenigmarchaeota archaeon]|nr:magnesium/cobalt transporter CorA [Candidatus Aenigmarchaeota archaeon]
MIKVASYQETGKKEIDSIQKVDMKSRNVIWIDGENPSIEERNSIAKTLDMDMDYIIDYLDEEEHARVEVEDDYISIIYTVPFIEGTEMETSSFGLFIKQNVVMSIHKTGLKALDTFEKNFDKTKNGFRKKLITNRYFFIYSMLDTINKDYLKTLNQIDDRIEELNAEIFKNPRDDHIQEILRHKKTLVYFSRALLANKEVLMLVKRGYLPNMSEDDIDNFDDLYSDVLQLIDMTSTYKELINNSMNLYHSSISNVMNVTMKKLTVLAVIFVVPTLISGIYGMNFSWMPFISDPFGFYYSLFIMVLLIAGLVIYVRRNDL